MRGMRKLAAILLAVMLCVGVMNIPVLAATTSQDGLEVTLTTDKGEYSQGEEIIATLTVKNTNDFAVNNVSLESIVPEGYELADGTDAIKKSETLEAGKTLEVVVTYAAATNGDSGEDETTEPSTPELEDENKDADKKDESSSVDTGDKNNIALYSVVLFGAFGVIIAVLINKKRGRNLLSILLCITMVGTSVAWPSMKVDAAETVKTIEVEEVIQVDGKDVTLKAEVNYQIVEDDQSEEKVEIIVDDDNLTYEDTNDCYYLVDDSIDSVKGKIVGEIDLLKSMEYEILDDQNIVIKKGNIEVAPTWSIDDIALVVGENTVSIKGTLADSNHINTSFVIMNASTKYVENADIDTDDNDGEGLNNYLEDYYSTDKDNADTDGDGLNDFIELSLLETDPNKKDSDENGTTDDLEDKDKDGINNILELKQGTDPALSDTDNDELNDYDEIETYKTDPLEVDTDGDGANDGWEVSNGYNPLEKENSFSIDEETSNADIDVKVEMDVDGNSVESLSITENDDDVFLGDDIPGYIGSAYDFSLSGKSFDSAKISFTFDESLLNDESFVPAIYYFNEDTQMLEELETVIEGNTASTTVSHFSTYILLNKTEFDKVWEEEIRVPSDSTETTNKNLEMMLIIDCSGSMGPQGSNNDPENIRLDVSKKLVEKLGTSDRVAVMSFGEEATLLTDFTSDKDVAYAAIDSVGNTDYETYINLALNTGFSTYDSSAKEDAVRYMILLTDGGSTDTVSGYEAKALERNIVIFTVGLGSGVDEDLLTDIATSTGGKYYFATKADDLYEIYDELEEDTVDYVTDSNEDGISDYYTKLICEGKLGTGTGVKLFSGVSFEDVQANADYDKDGLKNGEEVTVVENNGKVYLKVSSSPVLSDTDMDGYGDAKDKKPLVWNVGARDLAVFASLAYEDGSNYISKMYKASDIKGEENEPGESYYFLNGASLSTTDRGISEKWKVVDYVNTWEDVDTYFSATTFKNGNNVVIAYRGTNDPVGEWVNNIVGVGLLNYHSEEGAAKDYALKIADKYSNCDIYITGHSLGGYLAQIGAAEMLQNRTVNLESVMYFNGIGLKYNKLLFWSKNDAMDTLENYGKSHDLISYEIKGDVVSALGEHSGQVKSYYACDEARRHHAGKYGTGTWTDLLSKSATGWLCIISGDNLAQYYEYYGVQSVMEYFWVTHETDSFFYHLSQGSRGK